MERDYDSLERAHAPTGSGGTTYLRLARGALMAGKEVWGQEIRGFYEGHSLRWDAGNPQARVEPNWRLQVFLDTRDGRFSVEASSNSRTAFGMLTSFLIPFDVGDPMLVSAFAGTVDGTANPPTCVCLYRFAGTDFAIVPKGERYRSEREDWAGRLADYLEAIKGHAGYVEPKAEAEVSEFDLTDELLRYKGWPTIGEAPEVYRSVFGLVLATDGVEFDRLRPECWDQVRRAIGKTERTPKAVKAWLDAHPATPEVEEYDPFEKE
ncbi:MAG: hypothetical protein KIS66_13685 [Fimbriimonadaceae bacterium]|nr:hypothetical protein [Fimbriimonadaceae bacterium]